jgi:hypothetical protein
MSSLDLQADRWVLIYITWLAPRMGTTSSGYSPRGLRRAFTDVGLQRHLMIRMAFAIVVS